MTESDRGRRVAARLGTVDHAFQAVQANWQARIGTEHAPSARANTLLQSHLGFLQGYIRQAILANQTIEIPLQGLSSPEVLHQFQALRNADDVEAAYEASQVFHEATSLLAGQLSTLPFDVPTIDIARFAAHPREEKEPMGIVLQEMPSDIGTTLTVPSTIEGAQLTYTYDGTVPPHSKFPQITLQLNGI